VSTDPFVVTARFRRLFPALRKVPQFTARDLRDCLAGRMANPLREMLLRAIRGD
jgi:hypothetical protein